MYDSGIYYIDNDTELCKYKFGFVMNDFEGPDLLFN